MHHGHSHHDLPVAPNRLGQTFAASRPNQIWLADITYVPTGEGWLYLAIQRQKPPPGLIHHSDRGLGMPSFSSVRLTGRADCSTSRMISAFWDAEYLMPRPPHPRSRFF
jgi:transposase InsO family protein